MMNRDNPKIRTLEIDDNVNIAEKVVVEQDGPSGVGIRTVDSEGHSSAIDQKGEEVVEQLSGQTVKGEAGARETCEILMEKLNGDGGEWAHVESPTTTVWVDGFLHSKRPEIRPLPIQVTKAYSAIWGELARNPWGVRKVRNINEVCQTILDAIEKKKTHADPRITLALEAINFPITKLVVEKFIETNQSKARALGFKEIWLVGPTSALTYKLT